MFSKNSVCLLAALFVVAIAGPAMAGTLVAPVGATAHSFFAPDGRAPFRAIDGSGMDPNDPVTSTSIAGYVPLGAMWLSNPYGEYGIGFDFDKTGTGSVTVKVHADKCLHDCSNTGMGRELDGDRIDENGDDYEWEF